jgi:hypothetical protein
MVGDKKTRPKHMKRRGSWKDALRGFTSGSGNEEDRPMRLSKRGSSSSSGSKNPARRGTFLVPKPKKDDGQTPHSSDEDEEQDFNQWKEEDRPLQARVKYFYPPSEGVAASARTIAPLPLNSSILEKHQQELSAAVTEANNRANQEASSRKRREPIGTRLTMTSRTGYFQDRIISPSMVSLYL